jgi:ubiquinone/menaquinone biosynthesis C-methylase UbiE
MVDQKTEQSRSRYNRIAHEYEDTYDGRFTQPYNQFLSDRLALHDNDSVLDVACGNGRLLRMLAAKAHINAFGIDVSEEMITAAQSLQEEAVFRISPADAISFSDGMFDYVTVCCAFHHFSKPGAFAEEAWRVLKSSGTLAIADPLPSAFIRWIDNLLIPRMNMGDVRLYSIKELYAFLEKAGFENISHTRKRGMVIVEGTKR